MNPPIREKSGEVETSRALRSLYCYSRETGRFTRVVTSRVWDFLSNSFGSWGSVTSYVRELWFLLSTLGRSTYLVFF